MDGWSPWNAFHKDLKMNWSLRVILNQLWRNREKPSLMVAVDRVQIEGLASLCASSRSFLSLSVFLWCKLLNVTRLLFLRTFSIPTRHFCQGKLMQDGVTGKTRKAGLSFFFFLNVYKTWSLWSSGKHEGRTGKDIKAVSARQLEKLTFSLTFTFKNNTHTKKKPWCHLFSTS